MTDGGWRDMPLRLRVLLVLCVVGMGIAGLLLVFTEHTHLAWIIAIVAGIGNALVQWRARQPFPRSENDLRSSRLASGLDFLRPLRQRWDQLQDQLGGVPLVHVSRVPVETALGEVLAPKSGPARSSRVASLPRSQDYRVRIRIDGNRVKLTPSSTMYSWQPVFRGRAERHESGSALVGTISWSGPTRFFTVVFPFVGLTFVIVGVVLGLSRLANGHFASAGSALALVGFGLLFGGGSLLMSLWGASQAREDRAYLVEWLRVLLPPHESRPNPNS